MNLLEHFKAARRVGTPLIAIKTLDPELTMQTICSMVNSNGTDVPIIQWDVVRGMRPRSDAGQLVIDKAEASNVVNPVDSLVVANQFPYNADTNKPVNPILFMLNAHAFFQREYGDRASFIQAVWNLRTPYRDSGRTLVLLGPNFEFPPELSHDILLLDEPLPDEKQLAQIITDVAKAADVKLNKGDLESGVSALRGLVGFEAEQTSAMCMPKDVLEIDEMWYLKKQMISQTKGLSVWVGGQKFSGIGGIEEFKRRWNRIIAGKRKPKLIVWIDEIEKAMAGVGGPNASDSDRLGVILCEMQDNEYTGMLLVGPPGAAKSVAAKAVANECGCITLKVDLGGAVGEGLYGQAENEIRDIFKVIKAIAGPAGAFFICTSNDIRVVKPELKRRMKKGIWYFDIPDEDEKRVIVDIYSKKYPDVDLHDWGQVDSTDWTGAEIESCFQTAWEESVTLIEAARNIIPVAVSDREGLDRLRGEAAGKYNSASFPGPYARSTKGTNISTGRKIMKEDQ